MGGGRTLDRITANLTQFYPALLAREVVGILVIQPRCQAGCVAQR